MTYWSIYLYNRYIDYIVMSMQISKIMAVLMAVAIAIAAGVFLVSESNQISFVASANDGNNTTQNDSLINQTTNATVNQTTTNTTANITSEKTMLQKYKTEFIVSLLMLVVFALGILIELKFKIGEKIIGRISKK